MTTPSPEDSPEREPPPPDATPSRDTIRVAREAMATRFEIALHGDDPVRLRAAAEEALREIEDLEDRLSLYRETSEVSRVNALAGRQPVRVSPTLFRLLDQCSTLSQATHGAFDITIAPLMRCWGFIRAGGREPASRDVQEALGITGMHHVSLDAHAMTVRFDRPGVMLDLGAIGKGLAVEAALERLREAGVRHALVHGGTSTVAALGCQPDGRPWRVAVELQAPAAPPGPPRGMQVFNLQGQALSVSAEWGKSFQSRGRVYGHVLDPRTGEPVAHTRLAAVQTGSATESDALSTALMVLGLEGRELLRSVRPGIRGLLVQGTPEVPAVHHFGPG